MSDIPEDEDQPQPAPVANCEHSHVRTLLLEMRIEASIETKKALAKMFDDDLESEDIQLLQDVLEEIRKT